MQKGEPELLNPPPPFFLGVPLPTPELRFCPSPDHLVPCRECQKYVEYFSLFFYKHIYSPKPAALEQVCQ